MRNSGRCSPSDGPFAAVVWQLPRPSVPGSPLLSSLLLSAPTKGGAVIATVLAPTPGTEPGTGPSTGLRPGDLGLLLPAGAAWVVTAGVLGPGSGHGAVLAVVAGVAALLGLLLLVLGIRAFTGPTRGRRVVVTVAGVLLTAAAAAAATLLHTADLRRGPLPELARTGGPAPAVGVDLTVTGDPRVRVSRGGGAGAGQSLLTVEAVVDRVTVPDGLLRGEPGPRTVRTRTPVTVLVRGEDVAAWEPLLPSARLVAEVTVRPPGEGDHESAALLIAHGEPRASAPPSLPQRIAGRLRAGLRSATDGLPPDERGLLPGLVVGDTSRLPDNLREAFRDTDLAHLVAVSGANLAIVLGVLLGAPGRAGTAERRGLAALLGIPLRTTALVGAAVTLAFVTICRPEPSVLRAAGTGLIGLLALATGRPRRAVPALAGTALLLILLDPYLARSFGFLLSVLATAGLLVLGPRWADALRARGWPRHLAGAVGATAAAQALCAPVTVLLSGHVSLVGIPCNLLAELAVAPATLLGFAVLIADPVSPALARILAEPAAVPTGWLAAVARHGAELPGGRLSWPGGWFGAVSLAVGTAALCWTVPLLLPGRSVGPRRWRSPRGWIRPVVTGALLLVLLAVLLRPPPLARIATGWPPPDWRLVMCDVGQGDMVVLPVPPEGGGRRTARWWWTRGRIRGRPTAVCVISGSTGCRSSWRHISTRITWRGCRGCCAAGGSGRWRARRWTIRLARPPGWRTGRRGPGSRWCGPPRVRGGRRDRGSRGRCCGRTERSPRWCQVRTTRVSCCGWRWREVCVSPCWATWSRRPRRRC